MVVSRHPEPEIKVCAELSLLATPRKLPTQRNNEKASYSSQTSKPRSFFVGVCEKIRRFRIFFMLIARKSISPRSSMFHFETDETNQRPHVMTAQIPGPASEWVTSATQPFLLTLIDLPRPSTTLEYKGKDFHAFYLPLIPNWSGPPATVTTRGRGEFQGSINPSGWLDARK